MSDGLMYSPTLKAAKQALKVAQYQLKETTITELWPDLDLSLAASRQRIISLQFGGNEQGSLVNLYNVLASASYNLDVFGEYRRMVEISAANVAYQEYELGAARLSLTGNIVTTSISIASAREQIRVLREMIGVEKDILAVMKSQLAAGGISKEDYYTQKTLVAQTQAKLPPVKKTLAQEQHALAALVGKYTSQFAPQKINLNSLHLAKKLPLTLPSQLVKQRPDILAADALLHEASADIGVKTAQLLPAISISGTFGWLAGKPEHLFQNLSSMWSYGASLVQHILQEPAYIAARDASIATFKESLSTYKQTVLNAFQNVADSLRAIEFDKKLDQRNAQAEAAAYKTLRITKNRYMAGGESYLTLLNAQEQYLTTKLSRVESQALRLNDTAALFVALGGGWWKDVKK